MEMKAVVYSPPIEEEEYIPSLAWAKLTIQYATQHKSRIVKVIRGAAKGMTNLNQMDIEDIYSEVIEYLFKSEDYDTQKAIDKSNSGNVVTLEGYVNSCVKNCVKRFITATYRREKDIVRESIIDDEGKEKCIIDILEDVKAHKEFEDVGYDIKENLRNIECVRYKYGVDIFLILYVRLLTMGESETKYRRVLEVLGVSKKELSELEKKIANDEDVLQTIKALSLCNNDIGMLLLEETVYGAKKIRETVNSIK